MPIEPLNIEDFNQSRNRLPNPLHKYATYNVLFTLSGVRESEIRDGSYLTNPVRNVVARSSGIGAERFAPGDSINQGQGVFEEKEDALIKSGAGQRGGGAGIAFENNARLQEQYTESVGILRRNHDVFMENVNILSTIGPNSERNLANFTKMEFQVHEPYSITFIEKVRAATYLSGFLDYQDAPLLLTIEFRGFDENGRPLKQGMSETRKIPVIIVRVDFDVNAGGAQYNITAVPYGDLGFDDRFKVLRTSKNIDVNSAGQFETELVDLLDKQMEDEIKEKTRQFADQYRIEIDRQLLSGEVAQFAFSIHNSGSVGGIVDYGDIPGRPVTQTIDRGTTIPKTMEDFVRTLPGFKDIAQDFWRAYLTMAGYKLSDNEDNRITEIRDLLTNKDRAGELQNLFLAYQYVPWFKIKSTVYTDTSRLDAVTKMHPKEIVYKAIPYKIHVLKLLSTGLSIGRVNWRNLVRKNYDYIYTGDNLDVQGLRINYKSAYYMRNVRGGESTENESGLKKVIRQAAELVFGQESYPEPYLPLRSYPSIIKGRSTATTLTPEGDEKSQEFYDYLTNPEADMMRIELDILGDPHYLCQDVFAVLKRINDKKTESATGQQISDFDDAQFGSFNADSYMPLINLRYRLPADVQEKKGTMFSGTEQTRDDNLFFNGVYQVVKVESKFDQGQFLQTLTCVRMNNQQGEGTVPSVLVKSAINPDYTTKQKEADSQKKAQNIFKGAAEQYKGIGDQYKKIYGKAGKVIDTTNNNPRSGRG
jgi:hypothetical protein